MLKKNNNKNGIAFFVKMISVINQFPATKIETEQWLKLRKSLWRLIKLARWYRGEISRERSGVGAGSTGWKRVEESGGNRGGRGEEAVGSFEKNGLWLSRWMIRKLSMWNSCHSFIQFDVVLAVILAVVISTFISFFPEHRQSALCQIFCCCFGHQCFKRKGLRIKLCIACFYWATVTFQLCFCEEKKTA